MLWNYIVICQPLLLHFVEASITGVTYMDDFDFEQRYRNINECNPFYWHPLHLPKKCLKIFEKFIRSNVEFLPYENYEEIQRMSEYKYSSAFLSDLDYSLESVKRTLSPFELMFKSLRRDIQNVPSTPIIRAEPYLGMVAVYRQPVSYKSADMIKKMANVYI